MISGRLVIEAASGDERRAKARRTNLCLRNANGQQIEGRLDQTLCYTRRKGGRVVECGRLVIEAVSGDERRAKARRTNLCLQDANGQQIEGRSDQA